VTARAFRIAVESGELAGVLHLPDARPAACVVACHGLGGSKDGEKYLRLAGDLPAAGVAFARFDFRGSGASSGRHADATTASRVTDLDAVLEFLAGQPELDGRFGLLGSSLGGFVALWTASRRATALPVVTWNAPADLREVAASDPTGFHGAGAALVAEVIAGRHAEAPEGVSHVLVVQGGRDEVVPPAHGRALHTRCRPPKDLLVVEGADHRLADDLHYRQAMTRSLRWFADHLGYSLADDAVAAEATAGPGGPIDIHSR